MAPPPDPYRTLGLTRAATRAEVKQAYRRLAKANHPDAAGEAALPRFLAIQAAYDQIMGPGSTSGAGPAPRRPWDAEPDRADATHRAYGGRARRARSSGPRRQDARRGPAAGAAGLGTSGPDAQGQSRTGGPGPAPGAAGEDRPGTDDSGSPRGGSRRSRNKATLGSTSYDGADAEPFEPDWGGASWYGTTSGTYWTLNPKEYADPRKHGPEYQARARRAAAEARGGATAGPEVDAAGSAEPIVAMPSDAVDDTADAPAADAAAGGGTHTADAAGPADPDPPSAGMPPPTHTTASWWDATAGPTGDAAADPAAADDAMTATGPDRAHPTAQDSVAMATAAGWAWLDDDRPGRPARVARAIIGWIPVALAIGWLGGELTGCARFAADCDPSSSVATWLLQAVALAVLVLLPVIAAPAAIGAIAAIIVAVPAALILAAPGSEAPTTVATTALGILIAIAWVVGLGIGVGRTVRRTSKRLS
jgi:DnaJ domain